MDFRRAALLLVLGLGTVVPGLSASARELNQGELRALSAAGQSVALTGIYADVRASTGGEPVDVRAFDVGGVFYRVLVMMPDGTLGSVVVDAGSGAILPPSSQKAAEVREEATRSRGQGRALGRGQAGGQGQGQGQGGGNGNGGGNGGGGNGGGGGGGGGGGNGRN